MNPPSAHLRALRARVPDVRLFAPRVALVLPAPDGGVWLDPHGDLPQADVELEGSLAATAREILDRLGVDPGVALRPWAVRTGSCWQEEHPELGPLQPVWVVVEAEAPSSRPTGLVAGGPPALLSAPPDETLPASSPRDYIAAVRARIGHDRIFYPWAGLALRDARGGIFLVRLGQSGQWHCPGGGLEPGETVSGTAVRELEEETGLRARPGRLIGVWSAHLRAFANGDRIQGIATLLDGELAGGRLRPDPTGEIDRAGWFTAGELPPLRPPWDARVRLVLTGKGERLD